jgi:hypothetical protein
MTNYYGKISQRLLFILVGMAVLIIFSGEQVFAVSPGCYVKTLPRSGEGTIDKVDCGSIDSEGLKPLDTVDPEKCYLWLKSVGSSGVEKDCTDPALGTTVVGTAPSGSNSSFFTAGDSILGDPETLGIASSAEGKNVVGVVLNTVFLVLGTIAVLMILVGGVRFVIGRGDPGQIKQARDTVLYGAIGLVIVILATTIVGLVIGTTDKVLK